MANEIDWDKWQVIPGFSCLQYKWDVQARIAEELEGLSPEEELEYWRAARLRLESLQQEGDPVRSES